MSEPTWDGFHLNPGGFFQYRLVDGVLQVRRPWGDTVTDPKVHKFVTSILIPFADEIVKKAKQPAGPAPEQGDAV